MIRKILIFLFICVLIESISAQTDKSIVYLSLESVVDISLKDNLALKSKILDYEAQNLEEWKAISSFLPTFSYQGLAYRCFLLPAYYGNFIKRYGSRWIGYAGRHCS